MPELTLQEKLAAMARNSGEARPQPILEPPLVPEPVLKNARPEVRQAWESHNTAIIKWWKSLQLQFGGTTASALITLPSSVTPPVEFDSSAFVPITRRIDTTTPLTGGGTLTMDLMLGIGGLTTIGLPNQIVGVNAAGTAWEYKTLIEGANITITHGVGSVTIATTGLVGSHTLLDGLVHTDSVVQTVSTGSLIYGNATPKWDELTIGASGQFLKSNGTIPLWANILATDITSPFALTTNSDVNVTLDVSIGGVAALLTATALSIIWAGVLSLARGGTNNAITASAGAVVFSNSTQLALTAVGTTGQILVSQGTGTPIWQDPTAADTHNLLSATHLDTLTASVVEGDLIYGNATPKWARLAHPGEPDQVLVTTGSTTLAWGLVDINNSTTGTLNIGRGGTAATSFTPYTVIVAGSFATNPLQSVAGVGTTGQVLMSNGAGTWPTWQNLPSSAHTLLNATAHTDTVTGSPAEGDLIVGNATPAWTKFAIGVTGTFLKSTGAAPTWQMIKAVDVTAGQPLTAVNGANVTLTVSAPGASALLAATSLTLGWTGVLALSLGGTNNNLTASAGAVVFSNSTQLALTAVGTTGQILVSQGTSTPIWQDPSAADTHALLSATHTDTLAAAVVQGDLIFGNATPAWTRLAKDTTAAQSRYLSNTGALNAPTWAQVNLANGVTGTLPVGNGGTGATTFTQGSVIFMGATALAEDNANLFWNDTSNHFGIGTGSPIYPLHVMQSSTDFVVKITQQHEDGGGVWIDIPLSSGNRLLYLTQDNADIARVIINGDGTAYFNTHFRWLADLTYDIGLDGANRPRDLFLGRNLAVGGTATITSGFYTLAASPAQITADQNDYAIGAGTFFRLTSDASRTITGLTGGTDGKHLILVNAGSFNIVLANTPTASADANEIITGTGGNITLLPNERVELTYDATTLRWRAGAKVYSGGSATHNMLSATHSDTLTGSVMRGDLIVGNPTPNWARFGIGPEDSVLVCNGLDPAWGAVNLNSEMVTGVLAVVNGGTQNSSFTPYAVICGGAVSTDQLQSVSGVGSAGQILTSNGAGALPTWQAAAAADTHLLLSGTHTDTTGASPAVGDLITGQTGPVWAKLAKGGTGTVLRANATNAVYSTFTIPDTYTTGDILYSAASSALTALTAVATGNALISGGVATAPAWGKIGLTTHVSGTLPVASGGTNAGAFTQGSVVFAGASGTYTQDNANFFWDDTNNRHGIGNAAPTVTLDVTGTIKASVVVSIPVGSVAAPSLAITGDTNTGIYSATADTLSVATGGVECMRFRQLNAENTLQSSTGFLQLVDSASNGLLRMLSSASWNLTWSDSVATTYFQIGLTGNGTNYAAFSALYGSRFARLAYVADSVQITNVGASITPPVARLQVDDNNVLRFGVMATGHVGIGVSGPTACLHIKAGSTAASSAPLKFNTGSLLTTAEAGAVEFLTDKWYATITTGAARKEITLNDIALTSGRVPFVTTNGRLTDLASLTFGSSTLTIGTASATTGLIAFAHASSANLTKFQAGNATAAVTYTLPTADGSANQFLQTNGSGVLSWATSSAAPANPADSVQFNDGGAFGGDAGLTYNKTTDTLTILGAADGIRLYLQGHSSQTANMLEIRQSGGDLQSYIDYFGRFGPKMEGNAASAHLHIGAGAAGANLAPLKFTAGTNQSTAEAGTMEYNGVHWLTKTNAVRFSIGGSLFQRYDDSGNALGGEDTLYSNSIPANTFDANGHKVLAEYGLNLASTGGVTKRVRLKFGPSGSETTIFDSGALTISSASSLTIYATLICSASGTIRYAVSAATTGASTGSYASVGEITGLTLSNAMTLLLTGESGAGAANDDILAKMCIGRFEPAA